MDNHITKQGVLFKRLTQKPLAVRFDQEQASSDGGAVLLKACDERLGLGAAMAACLRDDRQQVKVEHSYEEIFQQRILALGNALRSRGNTRFRIFRQPTFATELPARSTQQNKY